MLSSLRRLLPVAAAVAAAASFVLVVPDLAAQDIKPRVIRFGFGNPETSPSGQGVKAVGTCTGKLSHGM